MVLPLGDRFHERDSAGFLTALGLALALAEQTSDMGFYVEREGGFPVPVVGMRLAKDEHGPRTTTLYLSSDTTAAPLLLGLLPRLLAEIPTAFGVPVTIDYREGIHGIAVEPGQYVVLLLSPRE